MPSIQTFIKPIPIIFLILILSAIDLAITSAYGSAIAHAPLQYAAKENGLTRASTASVVFYSGTVPLLSLLASFIMLYLHLRSSAPLIPTALATAIIITVVWIIQVGIWLDCEGSGPTIAESVDRYCPQYSLQDQGGGVANGLSGGKIAFAWIAVATEALYVGLCVWGIVGRKREMRKGVPLKRDSVEERELRMTAEA